MSSTKSKPITTRASNGHFFGRDWTIRTALVADKTAHVERSALKRTSSALCHELGFVEFQALHALKIASDMRAIMGGVRTSPAIKALRQARRAINR